MIKRDELIVWTCPDDEMFVGFDINEDGTVSSEYIDLRKYTQVVLYSEYEKLMSARTEAKERERVLITKLKKFVKAIDSPWDTELEKILKSYKSESE